MNKKGFTLMELLAVILIIAFLALIVSPVVLKTINDSQINIDKRSLEAYVRAIETSYYTEKANDNTLTPQKYIDEYISKLEYKGSKIDCSEIEVLGEKVEDIELYDCKINDRGYYSYINYKAEKIEGKSVFTITNNLVDIINNNDLITIKNGKSYNADLILEENYKIINITVLMNGRDVTNDVYSNNKITIERVTGDIEIVATALKVYNITNNLISITNENVKTEIYPNESYIATLIEEEGYSINSIIITMNGEDITSRVYNDTEKTINIENVTGNVEITASANRLCTITNNLTNVINSNTKTKIFSGESYIATVTIPEGFLSMSVIINMSDEDITSTAYNGGIISIPNITGDLVITAVGISQFAIDDWSTIVENVKNNNISAYPLGATKEVTLATLGTHTLRIANKSSDSTICTTEDNSKTACGFVLEFVDIIKLNPVNATNTNVGGWPASVIYKYLNETVYNEIPSSLRIGIIDTFTVSGHEGQKNENYTSTNKLYLLSTNEIYVTGPWYDTAQATTRQLDYYSSIGSTTSNKKGVIKQYNGVSKKWWLRCPYSNLTYNWCNVDVDGSVKYSASSESNGVSPAFRIGPSDNE